MRALKRSNFSKKSLIASISHGQLNSSFQPEIPLRLASPALSHTWSKKECKQLRRKESFGKIVQNLDMRLNKKMRLNTSPKIRRVNNEQIYRGNGNIQYHFSKYFKNKE